MLEYLLCSWVYEYIWQNYLTFMALKSVLSISLQRGGSLTHIMSILWTALSFAIAASKFNWKAFWLELSKSKILRRKFYEVFTATKVKWNRTKMHNEVSAVNKNYFYICFFNVHGTVHFAYEDHISNQRDATFYHYIEQHDCTTGCTHSSWTPDDGRVPPETCRVLLSIKSIKSCISLVTYMIFIYVFFIKVF